MIVNVRKQDWFTIPNILGYFRIALIPVFVWTYLRAKTTGDYLAAAWIIGLSGVTDLFDGLIARRFNQVTELGKVLDPIADKLTQCALAFCLASRYGFMWIMAGLLVVKESCMTVLGLALYRHNRRKLNGAMWFGKVATAFLYGAVFLLLLAPGITDLWANVLILVSCGLQVVSFAGYGITYRRLWRLAPLSGTEEK